MKFVYGSVSRHAPPILGNSFCIIMTLHPPKMCLLEEALTGLCATEARETNTSLSFQGHVKAFEKFHSSSTLSHSVLSLVEEWELSHTFIYVQVLFPSIMNSFVLIRDSFSSKCIFSAGKPLSTLALSKMLLPFFFVSIFLQRFSIYNQFKVASTCVNLFPQVGLCICK